MTDVCLNGMDRNKGPKHKYTVSVLFIFVVCTIFLLIRMSDTSVSFCGLLTVLTKNCQKLIRPCSAKKLEFMVLTVRKTHVLCLFNYFSTEKLFGSELIMDYKLCQNTY